MCVCVCKRHIQIPFKKLHFSYYRLWEITWVPFILRSVSFCLIAEHYNRTMDDHRYNCIVLSCISSYRDKTVKSTDYQWVGNLWVKLLVVMVAQVVYLLADKVAQFWCRGRLWISKTVIIFAVTNIDCFCNVGIYRFTFLLHVFVWVCVQVINISELV